MEQKRSSKRTTTVATAFILVMMAARQNRNRKMEVSAAGDYDDADKEDVAMLIKVAIISDVVALVPAISTFVSTQLEILEQKSGQR